MPGVCASPPLLAGAFEGPLDLDKQPDRVDPSPSTPPSSARTAARVPPWRASRAVATLQRLVADLFSLPSESDVNGRYVQLPRHHLHQPRLRKPMTKWEKFAGEGHQEAQAQQDGLRRADGRVGAATGTTAPATPTASSSWTASGPKRAATARTRSRRGEGARRGENAGRQQKNLLNAVATHGTKGPPDAQDVRRAEEGAKALPVDKMGKNQIKDLTAHVAKSTASIGKFTRRPGDEKIKTRGKRRQFDSVTDTGRSATRR